MLSFGLESFLWFGLGLVPLAVFYFLRLRFRRRPVGSTYVWKKLADKHGGGRRLRLRSVLLFLLQVAALVCAVVAGALPALNSRQFTKPGLALLVDVSASMAAAETTATGPSRTRIDQAKQDIKRELASLSADTPVAVFALSTDARLVAGPVAPAAALSLVDTLSAGSSGFAEGRSAGTLRAWLSSRDDSWSGLLVSDGGADLGGRALSAAFDGEMRVLQVGSVEGNVGISGLRLLQNQGQGSEPSIARFTVRNGFEDSMRLMLILNRDGKQVAAFPADVPRGTSELNVPADIYAETGAYELSVVSLQTLSANGRDQGAVTTGTSGTAGAAAPGVPGAAAAGKGIDALAIDDKVYLAVNEPRVLRVLAIGAQNPFIDAAFNYAGIEYASSDTLPESFKASDWDLVVFDHVAVPAAVATNVLAFGSLPPDSGLRFGDEISGTITSADATHPVGRFIQWDGLEKVSGRVVVPGALAVPVREIAAINGRPVIVAWEKDGLRHAASSVDLFSSGFGLSGAFPVFVRNFLLWIAPQSDDQLEYTLRAGEKAFRNEKPGWRIAEQDRFDLEPQTNGVAITPKEPGIFHWQHGNETGLIAVNPPVEESDLLQQTLRIPDAPGRLVATETASITPLQTFFLIALFLCLVAEWFLWRGAPGVVKKDGPGAMSGSSTRGAFSSSVPPRAFGARLRSSLGGVFIALREWFGTGKTRSARLGMIRLAVLLIAIVAMAGIALPLPDNQRNLAIVVDVSDSMGRAAIEEARGLAQNAVNELTPGDRASLVLFAGRARLVSKLDTPGRLAAELPRLRLEAPEPGASDLGAAMALAERSLQDSAGNKEILVLSDGRSNKGTGIADAAGIRVRSVALGRVSDGVVSQALALPEIVHPRENVVARWQFSSDRAQELDLRLSVDDKTLIRQRISVGQGAQEIGIPLQVGESGSHVVKVDVSRPGEQAMPAGTIGAVIEAGEPAAVLMVREGFSPLTPSLRTQGIIVREIATQDLPSQAQAYSGVSAVILDNVSALNLSSRQMDELETYVLGGGGLFVLGGDESLARGAYYDTAIEHMLPVSTDTRRRLLFARNKILFVIDHSGSMSDSIGGTTKRLAALRGVADSIRELRSQDEVGVLGFDTEARWVVPFTSLERRDEILDALASTGEGGGTDIAVAMDEMIKAFGAPGPVRRHAVLVTDGQTPDADFRGLAESLAAANVTLTTIGIGEDVNETLLKNIAAWAGGTYYKADVERIPRIIDNETVRITREAMREGTFAVTVPENRGMTADLPSRMPAIKGYMLVEPKQRSQVLMTVQDPANPDKADALLTAWRYGNGQVAVFASDSGKRWLSGWVGSAAYQRLWAQVLRGIERGSADRGMRVTARLEGGLAHLSVEAISEDRSLRTGLQLNAHVAGDDSSWFALRETAPGHYEGDSAVSAAGVVRFEVADASSRFRSASSWLWVPPGAELAFTGPDRDALSALSAGAEPLDPRGALTGPVDTVWSPSPVAGILLAVLVILFLAEMALRSTAFGQLTMALAAFRVWWTGQQKLFGRLTATRKSVFDDGPAEAAQKRVVDAYLYLARAKKQAHEDRLPADDKDGGKSGEDR